MGHLKRSRDPRDETERREHLPVMGSRFSSRARSFEASCHSLVMDCGGGPANDTVSTVGKKAGRVFPTPTEGPACEVQSTSGRDTDKDSQYEFWHATGRVEISTGSVRSEGNVVSCIYRDSVSNDNPEPGSKRCVKAKKKPDIRTGFFLVQRKSFPVPLLELFELLVDGKLFICVQFLPLGLNVGQRDDGVVRASCGGGSGSGGERTRELPVGSPDGAEETSSVHWEGEG